MKIYSGIENVKRAMTHDKRRHTDKRKAYKTMLAYEKAKREVR